MRKQSFSKKLTASVCTAALALSMPMMAYATGADGEIMPLDDTPSESEQPAKVEPAEGAPVVSEDGTTLTQEVEVSSPTNENVGLTGEATVEVSVATELNQSEVNSLFAPTKAEIADGKEAATPIIEASDQTSLAYQNAINGVLDNAANHIDENEVIGTSNFKLSTSGAKADNGTVDVTVVYTVDENAQGITCTAYVTIYDAEHNFVRNEVLTSATIADGTCDITVTLADGQTADVTLALQNQETDVTTENQVAPEDADQKDAIVNNGSLAQAITGTNTTDGKVTYQVTTATVQQLDAAGKLVWNAQAKAQVVEDHTAAGATAAAGALTITPTNTPHGLWTSATEVDKQNAISDPMNFQVSGDDNENIKDASVVVELPGMDGKTARVYQKYTNADGEVVNDVKNIVVENGQIVLSNLSFSTRDFTIVLFDNGTTVNPGDDIVPPVDPENPDNPAVVPGEDVTDPTDEGTENGSKDKANGVKAADNGKTSPKTGVIL